MVAIDAVPRDSEHRDRHGPHARESDRSTPRRPPTPATENCVPPATNPKSLLHALAIAALRCGQGRLLWKRRSAARAARAVRFEAFWTGVAAGGCVQPMHQPGRLQGTPSPPTNQCLGPSRVPERAAPRSRVIRKTWPEPGSWESQIWPASAPGNSDHAVERLVVWSAAASPCYPHTQYTLFMTSCMHAAHGNHTVRGWKCYVPCGLCDA